MNRRDAMKATAMMPITRGDIPIFFLMSLVIPIGFLLMEFGVSVAYRVLFIGLYLGFFLGESTNRAWNEYLKFRRLKK